MLLALASANSFVGAALTLPVPFSSAISLDIIPSRYAIINPTGSESIIDETTQNVAKMLFHDWGQQPTEFPNCMFLLPYGAQHLIFSSSVISNGNCV